MSEPVLIVVSGPPCSGKSCLATRLGERLGWAVVRKDEFKELLFDTLGAGDAEWSGRLSLAAFEIQFRIARDLLDAGCSVLLEGNFRAPAHGSRIAGLAGGRARLLQIACRAEAAELAARRRARAVAGGRHPGHLDALPGADPIAYAPLPITPTLEHDTTGEPEAAFDALLRRLAAAGLAV